MDQIMTDVHDSLGIKKSNIGGHNFEITLLPCGLAGEVFFKAMDIAGPSVGMAIDKWRNLDYVSPEQDDSFAEILTMLTTKLNRGELDFVIENILKDCTIDSRRFDRNSDLRGEFSVYMKLIRWAMEENFSDFFTDALKEIGLEIDTLRNFMDMMKKQDNQDTTQEVQSKEST